MEYRFVSIRDSTNESRSGTGGRLVARPCARHGFPQPPSLGNPLDASPTAWWTACPASVTVSVTRLPISLGDTGGATAAGTLTAGRFGAWTTPARPPGAT